MSTNTENLHEVVNRALKMWVELTGFDPGLREDGSRVITNYQLDNEASEIQRAQEIDSTGLTAWMILRSKTRAWASRHKFSALRLLGHPEEVESFMRPLRELWNVLETPVARKVVDAFRKDVRQAASLCSIDEDKVDEVLNDLDLLAEIRRDALISRNYLRIHTFERGERAESLGYNPKVVKFWNANSMLRAGAISENGISVCMIRDPEATSSYFAFLVRDGDWLTMWTDAARDAHPLQAGMSRSRASSRRFMDRAFRLRFPYQLFEFEFQDDHYIGEHSTSLVPVNVEGIPVCGIEELPADQAIWLVMMFSLIAEDPHEEEEDTYTGEGMVTAERGDLTVPGTWAVDPIDPAELTTERIIADCNLGREPRGQHEWMLERYGDQVPSEAVNLIGRDTKMLPSGEIVETGDLTRRITGEDPQEKRRWNRRRRNDFGLVSFDPERFDTPERMESDRLWLARYNQAKIVEECAWQEFDERKDEIRQWYRKAVRDNADALVEAAATGEFETEKMSFKTDGFGWDIQRGNIVEQCYRLRHPGFLTAEVRLYDRNDDYCRGFISGKQASVWTRFSPETAAGIAKLAGCLVEDLPPFLRQWTKQERYVGNSILDRIDPLDWVPEDPWREIKFQVLLGLSKSTWNQLLRDRDLPKRDLPEYDGVYMNW